MPKGGRTEEVAERDRRRHAWIRELRETTNLSNSEIAAMVGCSVRQVGRVVERMNLPRKGSYRPPIPPEKLAEIEKFLIEEHPPATAVAEVFGVGREVVERHFPEHRWTRQESGRHAGQVSMIARRARRKTYASGSLEIS